MVPSNQHLDEKGTENMKETSKEEFNRKTHDHSGVQATSVNDLGIDVDYFQKFLDDPNASEEQKCELIGIVWSIVCSAVDIGFNVHPLQRVKATQPEESLPAALLQLALEDE